MTQSVEVATEVAVALKRATDTLDTMERELEDARHRAADAFATAKSEYQCGRRDACAEMLATLRDLMTGGGA